MGTGWDALVKGFNNADVGETDTDVKSGGSAWDRLMESPSRRSSPRARTGTPFVPDESFKSGVIEAAEELGIDPVDLATVISYETGGTFNPTKEGPTTKWGTHRGLIQFGEPQSQEYGVDWDNPQESQLGAQGAIVNYLRKTGVQPGMGLLDVYSAVNAGGVGRYDRSDEAAGGAPGTVRDKVENQMAGHRENAIRLLGRQPQPSQTPQRNRLWLDF